MTHEVFNLGRIRRDGRVRAVISWNSCEPVPTSWRAVPDFDLFLFNHTTGLPYYASMSFDNNNEGFDVDLAAIPGNNDGDQYSLIVGWLPNGTHSECPDSPGAERIGWSFSVWGRM